MIAFSSIFLGLTMTTSSSIRTRTASSAASWTTSSSNLQVSNYTCVFVLGLYRSNTLIYSKLSSNFHLLYYTQDYHTFLALELSTIYNVNRFGLVERDALWFLYFAFNCDHLNTNSNWFARTSNIPTPEHLISKLNSQVSKWLNNVKWSTNYMLLN